LIEMHRPGDPFSMIVGGGVAALLTGLVLLGLFTGRIWVGRRFPSQSGDQWADRRVTPLKFWWGVVFYMLVVVFLWSGVLFEAGWIDDPASFLNRLYRSGE
jgi:hypothetical protein